MNYDPVASVYDFLGVLYSGGGIAKTKCAHLSLLKPGDRVLYVGAGSGAECQKACQLGAEVTVLDLSERMIARARARFQKAGMTARFLCEDALSHRGETYDVVVAPFFLNVFSQVELPAIIAQLCQLLPTGGHFVSADFRAPSRRMLFSALQRAYYLPPLLLFRLLTGNPWHEIYDYDAVIKRNRLPLALDRQLVVDAYGLPLLETLVWTRA